MSIWSNLKNAFRPADRDPEAGEDNADLPDPDSSEVNLELLRHWKTKGESDWTVAHDLHEKFLAFSFAAEESQWDPEVLEKRKGKLPVLQFGFINGMILQVVNPVRENPPGIVFKPVGISNQAKLDARILTGVARADESRSDAESIYLEAFEMQTRGGFGAWFYEPIERNGEWKIKLKSVDPTSVYQDQSSREDPRWQLMRIKMSDYDYRRRYPHGAAKAEDGVVEVWSAFVKDLVTEIGPPEIQADGMTIKPKVEQRERVRHFVFDNETPEILRETQEYKGTELPIVIEEAPSVVIAKERWWFPLTHHAHEQQRARNFWLSDATFEQSSKPKNKWIADEDALVNPHQWNAAATAPRTALFKKKGTEVEQMKSGEAPVGFLDLASAMLEDARNATGIHPDPSLQAKMDMPSGKAIKQQQAGSGVANYHHLDQHKKALRRGAKIHFDMIRAYYNDDQIRESLGVDGSVSKVSLGPTQVEGASNIDLSEAEFLVDLDTGANYATQREEAQDQWMEFVKGVEDPHLVPLVTYWLLKLSTLQGSEDVADWYMETLPQNIQDAIKAKQPSEDAGDPAEQLRAAQQMIAQLKDHLTQTTQALQHETQQLQQKRPEIESRERIAMGAQQSETEREEMRIRAGHIKTDVEAERDERLSQMEAAHAKDLEELKGQFSIMIENLRGEFALEKQTRENASDERMAEREGVRVEVET